MVNKTSKKSKNESNVNVKSSKNLKSETPKSTAKRTSKVAQPSSLNSTPKSTAKRNTKVNYTWSANQNVNTQSSISENSSNVSLTTYKAVSKNIYNDGRSYRVRVTINGETISVSTSTKKDAFKVRKQLFELREQRA